MVAHALTEFPVQGLDLLLIENVGNLICPASYDLGESLRVVICCLAEGAEKPKKYAVMFHKADVVLLNKTDLATASGIDLRELEKKREGSERKGHGVRDLMQDRGGTRRLGRMVARCDRIPQDRGSSEVLTCVWLYLGS